MDDSKFINTLFFLMLVFFLIGVIILSLMEVS